MKDSAALIAEARAHPALSSRYLELHKMPWEKSKFPGISVKILLDDKETGFVSMLLKLEPGAVLPPHEHTGIEQTFVIEGSLDDDEGSCTAGNFVWRPAGSRHVAHAPNGALILSFFARPNVFFEGQRFFTADRAA